MVWYSTHKYIKHEMNIFAIFMQNVFWHKTFKNVFDVIFR